MKNLIISFFIPGLLIACAGCDKTESLPIKKDVKHVTLLYAVNRSSLAWDFKDDMQEMEAALTSIQSEDGSFLVYCTDSDGETATLYEADKDKDGKYSIKSLPKKTYPRDVPSTDPARISDVISEALKLYPEAEYSLIFWGHGSSWTPEFSSHTVAGRESEEDSSPVKRSYGGEFTGNLGDWSNIDWTDLKELASAIPDGRFKYIWFDCCYMSGIETIYELRNKCSSYVAYPTEVWQYGLPYDIVLPHIFKLEPDLEGGARAFYDYYNNHNDPVTVTVIDMNNVERVADCAKEIISLGFTVDDKKSLLNYSRDYKNPYYDFRQIMTEMSSNAGRSDLVDKFRDVFGSMVTYSAGSDKNFNRIAWNLENLSGVSSEYIDGSKPQAVENYYKTLDWYIRVYND